MVKDKTPKQAPDTSKVKNALYGQAIKTLRENHADEFVEIITSLYDEKGLSYKRRLTAAEKAEREQEERVARANARLEAVYAQYPEVRPETPAL